MVRPSNPLQKFLRRKDSHQCLGKDEYSMKGISNVPKPMELQSDTIVIFSGKLIVSCTLLIP